MRDMTRKEKQLSPELAREILRTGQTGFLATADKTGQPYCIPVNYLFQDECLYFHKGLEGHALDNIRANPEVCFTVVGASGVLPDKFTTHYESVVLFGRAEIVEDEGQKLAAMRDFVRKYCPDFMDKAEPVILSVKDRFRIIKITPSHITAKRSGQPTG